MRSAVQATSTLENRSLRYLSNLCTSAPVVLGVRKNPADGGCRPTPYPSMAKSHPANGSRAPKRLPKNKNARHLDRRGLPDGRGLILKDIELLNRVARESGWVQFGVCQITAMINVDERAVSAVAMHPQSPFSVVTKKARPEDVSKFLLNPPKGFEVV